MQNGVGRGRVTGYWRFGKDAGAWMSVAAAHGAGRDYFLSRDGHGNERAEQLESKSVSGDAVPARRTASRRTGFRATATRAAWTVHRVHRERSRVVESLTMQWFLTTRKQFLPSGEYETTFNDPNTNFTDTRGFVEARYEPQVTKETQLFLRAHVDMYNFDDYLAYPSPTVNPNSQGPEQDLFRGRWSGLEARVQYSTEKLRLMAGGEGIYHFQTLQEGNTATQPVVFDNNGNPGRNDPFVVGAAFVNADIVPTRR